MRCVVGVTYFFLARLPIVYEMYAIDWFSNNYIQHSEAKHHFIQLVHQVLMTKEIKFGNMCGFVLFRTIGNRETKLCSTIEGLMSKHLHKSLTKLLQKFVRIIGRNS